MLSILAPNTWMTVIVRPCLPPSRPVPSSHSRTVPWPTKLPMLIDIGLLEGSRVFQGYRMIVFGGLVAVLLAFRPRGLLDERLVHRLRLRAFRPL